MPKRTQNEGGDELPARNVGDASKRRGGPGNGKGGPKHNQSGRTEAEPGDNGGIDNFDGPKRWGDGGKPEQNQDDGVDAGEPWRGDGGNGGRTQPKINQTDEQGDKRRMMPERHGGWNEPAAGTASYPCPLR